MPKIVIGSIFDSTCDYIVNPVNCVGVMGAGLAKQFKERYPENFSVYKYKCDNRQLTLGDFFVFHNSAPKIINFATKNHWKDRSKLDVIEAGLRDLLWTLEGKKFSVAFPLLGAGCGGIPPTVAFVAIKRVLSRSDIDSTIYIQQRDKEWLVNTNCITLQDCSLEPCLVTQET